MEIRGTRLGTLEFKEEEIIRFPEGLLGFPLSTRYILFPYGDDSPFFWLQSVDEAEIAFLVINPFQFFNDLEFVVQDEDSAAIGLQHEENAEIFSMVTIPEGRPEEMRTNLAGPLLVNVLNRTGRQILMKEYSPRQQLIPEQLRDDFKQEAQKGRTNRLTNS